MRVSGNSGDSLKFKVPTLRNVALTSYFAHDGRFPAFTQLIDHYVSGIEQGPTLDPALQNGIPLSDLEKFYIQEFLFTLTDSTLISDERFK
jgi:cytochrome c peroxidase